MRETRRHADYHLVYRSIVTVVFFCCLLSVTTDSLANESRTYIGIQPFTISTPALDYYRSLDVLLFQRLNFEVLPHQVSPLLIRDTIPEECIALASGSIEIIDSLPFLLFTIRGRGSNVYEEESKKIPLSGQPVDAIVDAMALKMHHFLEQNISGNLRINSNPLDCSIYLNGIKIGNTPAELSLGQGRYALRLQRPYFHPFRDSVSIIAGRDTLISADMLFEGHRVKPWIISAGILTLSTILLQAAESYFQSEYLSISDDRGDLFDPYFNRYKTANIIKITLLIPTVTTWTMALSNFLENRSLKNRIFN